MPPLRPSVLGYTTPPPKAASLPTPPCLIIPPMIQYRAKKEKEANVARVAFTVHR